VTLSDDVGQRCRELATVVDQYRGELARKAETESEFKKERAKRMLRARADGEASSAALAEIVADADDVIADLRLQALIAEGIAKSTKERIDSLKERIGFGRSLLANQRAVDQLHSQDRSVA
jgi:hypothetical protein